MGRARSTDLRFDRARLRRHVVLNGVAWVVPALVAILATPALAHHLGPDRFGLLALGWAATSFYAVLDVGIGRTLTAAVAEGLTTRALDDLPDLIWSGTWAAALILGGVAGFGMLGAPAFVDQVLTVPSAVRTEAIAVVRWLALGVPIVVLGVLWRAVLEGAQQFGRINLLRLPLNLITWGGPWLAVRFTQDVRVLVGVMIAGRALYLLAHLPLLSGAVPKASRPRALRMDALRQLGRRGGWLAVSGIVSPVLVNLDRLLLPGGATIATVGWYVAAGDGAMRLWLFTAALQPVFFSAIAAATVTERRRLPELVGQATRATVGVLLPTALVLGWWADPLLRWWLDAAFTPLAVPAFRVALAAVFSNAVAQVAYSALQGAGEQRIVAMVHLIEFGLFAVAAPIALRTVGPLGLLVVWALRLSLDGVALWRIAWRRIPETRDARPLVLVGGALGTLLILATILR